MHIFRGLYYGSYKEPREVTMDNRNANLFGNDGNSLYGLCTSLGSNVFWGATVITGLFGAIPFVGESLRLGC